MPVPQGPRLPHTLVSAALVCVLAHPAAARAGPLGRANTWSATSTTGLSLMGTWTAVPDPLSGAVAGTWTLFDARGTTVARGGWSATKSTTGWSGAWRAAAARGTTEYSGTWKARVATLGASAPLAELFEKALEDVVSGNWQAGSRSGAWSIRAFK